MDAEETEKVRVKWKQGQGLLPGTPTVHSRVFAGGPACRGDRERAAGEADNTRSVSCWGSQEQKVMGGGNSPLTLTLLGCQVRGGRRIRQDGWPSGKLFKVLLGAPPWLHAKESGCQCRRHVFDP